MKLLKYFSLFIILSFPALAAAQESSRHPIDATLDKCLQTAKATMPRAKCYSTASDMWEKAVDVDYRKLLKQLSPEMRKILSGEQTAWEKYRNENQNFLMAKYGSRKGSGYISVRIIELMKPNKERALELESRFED